VGLLMLKAQLGSKLLHPKWRDVEDILTGDFFGALDYLPRMPYMRDFVAMLSDLNPLAATPEMHDVEWDAATLFFWPRIIGDSDTAEPDVVIVSNKWVLVIEVKLDASLGHTQPWREYIAGQAIALEHGLPPSSVYYVLLGRERIPLTGSDTAQLAALRHVTSYLEWHQVVSLVESWYRRPADLLTHSSHHRLLADLLAVLRRRRAIAFSGFAFANPAQVDLPPANFFCPPLFSGFLQHARRVNPPDRSAFFLSAFCGFLHRAPAPFRITPIFFRDAFRNFSQSSPPVRKPDAAPVFLSSFDGFLNCARSCIPTSHQFLKGPSV